MLHPQHLCWCTDPEESLESVLAWALVSMGKLIKVKLSLAGRMTYLCLAINLQSTPAQAERTMSQEA